MQNPQQNINLDEVATFDSLAHSWWDPDGELKTLHAINPLRLRYIDDAISLVNRRVLDIGCGGGILCEAMAEKTAQVTGIDASRACIEIARQHQLSKKLSINYLNITVEEFADANAQKFDVITCLEMLEHVPDPVSIIKTASSLLEPGGHLFLSTINRSFKSWFGTIIAAEYLLKLIPKGTHHYAGFIRPSELCQWLRLCGFDVENISGVKYIPLINYAGLDDRPSVNYIVHARLKDPVC